MGKGAKFAIEPQNNFEKLLALCLWRRMLYVPIRFVKCAKNIDAVALVVDCIAFYKVSLLLSVHFK